MAEHVNLDKQVEEDEALVLRIGGKEYRVTDIPVERFEQADARAEELRHRVEENGARDPYILHRQLAIMLGLPEETFFGEGYRKITKAIRIISEHIADQRGRDAGKGGPPVH